MPFGCGTDKCVFCRPSCSYWHGKFLMMKVRAGQPAHCSANGNHAHRTRRCVKLPKSVPSPGNRAKRDFPNTKANNSTLQPPDVKSAGPTGACHRPEDAHVCFLNQEKGKNHKQPLGVKNIRFATPKQDGNRTLAQKIFVPTKKIDARPSAQGYE